MKSNINELFEERINRYKGASDIDIEAELDEIMPKIRFDERVSKKDLARCVIRGRLTTAMNLHQIYSFEKGHFVYIENANEDQLRFFMEKAERDSKAAEARKASAEERIHQISMSWDADGNFIGFHIPEAAAL